MIKKDFADHICEIPLEMQVDTDGKDWR